MDNVFTGNSAAQWHRDVGAYGDPVRMALLNHVLVRVLDRVAAAPAHERTDCSKDHICRALEDIRQPDQLGRQQTADRLLEWHVDAQAIGERYSNLDGSRLWDFGCGNAYLGAWLSGFGVSYLGLEPSTDLIEIAKMDGRLSQSGARTRSFGRLLRR